MLLLAAVATSSSPFTADAVASWTMLVLAAMCIGMTKGGLGGLGLLPVILMAEGLRPGFAAYSTGVVLPLLIVGDAFAVAAYRRHAQWPVIRRLLPTALLGIVIGWLLMRALIPPTVTAVPAPTPGSAAVAPVVVPASAAAVPATAGQSTKDTFKHAIGWTILSLAALQIARMYLGKQIGDAVIGSPIGSTIAGLLGGTTTMLANAAGPVMSLYMLAVNLPKLELIGTGAWFFFIINICKLPFSYDQGLINKFSLTLLLYLAPVVIASVFLGRYLVRFLSQRVFETFLLVFAILGGLRLVMT